MLICHECDVGVVSVEQNATSCTKCPTGFSSKRKGSATCTSCGAGKYSNEQGVECKQCPEGYYRINDGNSEDSDPITYTSCVACPSGYYQNNKGRASCLLPSGSYTNEEGKVKCTKCAQNTISMLPTAPGVSHVKRVKQRPRTEALRVSPGSGMVSIQRMSADHARWHLPGC